MAWQEAGVQTREGQHPPCGGGEGEGDDRETTEAVLTTRPSVPAPTPSLTDELSINQYRDFSSGKT